MSFWGVLGLLQKAYSLGFSARRPPRGKAALSWRLACAQIKPTKINLSLFGTRGNVRPEGMFNRVRLAPEARRAYDTRGVVVGDVLKRLVKQERPQRLPKECPKLPAEKERP